MKFIIRDVLWLIVVAALVVGWYLSRSALVLVNQRQSAAIAELAEASRDKFIAINQAYRMRGELLKAKKRCDELEQDYNRANRQLHDRIGGPFLATHTTVDWSILDESLPPKPATPGR